MTVFLFGLYYAALLFFIVPRIRTAHNRQRVLTWPQTKAIIDEKVVLEEARPSRQGTGLAHASQVHGHLKERYAYYVGGQKYESQLIEPGFDQQHRHYRNMARFHLMRREQPVVYFNPQQPEEAYLQPGQDPLSWRVLGWGSLLLGGWPLLLLV
ncbi:hypothetical protein LEM8419_02395 [Neolewinella maritima]|uniref:DUF3592 domain-containing protein n=1 Tax=Neolewinella maritima TaxID=1383882 RepID=A0ABM9B2U2_9BACT|nr:hypothetical protein [Neolewinella maritima]CAH1001492.1 hypothetical protein LEM8419_02395 [Neolewinella maritima]